MSRKGIPVCSSRSSPSTSCRYGCTAARRAAPRPTSSRPIARAARSRSCNSAPSAIKLPIGRRPDEAGGCSTRRMNLRTQGFANCCSTRGLNSLRVASFRLRTCAGSDTRWSCGRGECSSSPYPLSTNCRRSCAKSPCTLYTRRVLVALAPQLPEPRRPPRLGLDECAGPIRVALHLSVEHLPRETEEPYRVNYIVVRRRTAFRFCLIGMQRYRRQPRAVPMVRAMT